MDALEEHNNRLFFNTVHRFTDH